MDYRDFELSACRAAVFTPDEDVSVGRLMRDLYPRWTDFFDGDPVVMPSVEGMPSDIARVTLSSKSGLWSCAVSPAKLKFLWNRTTGEEIIAKEDFVEKATYFLLDYNNIMNVRINRLGSFISRYAMHEAPAKFLAGHFCNEKRLKGPLNRPEGFELHAHKRYMLANEFYINSWARSKTGRLTADPSKRLVGFEQDLNTVSEEGELHFDAEKITRFFKTVVSEFDKILKLYFPSE